MRRRAHLELRRVPAPDRRASCSTSTTSTRRFRARSSGTSSGWPQASRSPARQRGSGARRSARTPVRLGQAIRTTHRRSASRTARAQLPTDRGRAMLASLDERRCARRPRRQEGRQRSRKNTSTRVEQARRDRRRATRIVAHPPLIVRIDDESNGRPRQSRDFFDAYLPIAAASTAVTLLNRYSRRRRPQGRRRRQRRDPLHDPAARERRRPPTLPAVQGGRCLGARAVLRAEQFAEHGERMVQGTADVMQTTGDIFLGWARLHAAIGPRADFYFRQLWDGKGRSIRRRSSRTGSPVRRSCGRGTGVGYARRATLGDRRLSRHEHDVRRSGQSSRTATPTSTRPTTVSTRRRSLGRIDAVSDI